MKSVVSVNEKWKESIINLIFSETFATLTNIKHGINKLLSK